MDPPVLLQELSLALLIILLGSSGIPVFINVGTELPHRRRLNISRRLIRRVPKVFLEISPILDGIILVTTFRDLGLEVEDGFFLQELNFYPVTLA